MKTPDPNHSTQYGPLDSQAERAYQHEQISEDLDPLNVLLAEEAEPEINDERLYTDEFIRANENASRSLMLGFLGIALLVTSLFAWFIFSQPQDSPQEENSDVPSSPIRVPSSPPSQIPDLQLDSPDSNQTVPPPGASEAQPNGGAQDPPLVFPATPDQPSSVSPSESATPQAPSTQTPSTQTPSTQETEESLPEGIVPPPPPLSTP